MSSKIETFIEDHGKLLILCVLTLGFALLSLEIVNQTPYAIEDEQEDIFIVFLALGLLLLFVLWLYRLLGIIDCFNLLPSADRVIVFVVIVSFLYCIIGLPQCITAQTSYAWFRQNTHVCYSLSGDAYRIVKKDSYFVFLNHNSSAVSYSLNEDTNKFVLNNHLAIIGNNSEIPAINVNGVKLDSTTYLWGLSEKEAAQNEWNLYLNLAPKSISISNSTNVTFVNDAATKVLNLNLDFD